MYRLTVICNFNNYKGEIQNAQWVDAQNLKAGYKLLSEKNHWQTVKGVTIKAENLSAYNLIVENDHTYFIKGANSDLDGGGCIMIVSWICQNKKLIVLV